MEIFYSNAHRQHDPPFEVFDGGVRVPYLEKPDRMDRILTALEPEEWAEIRTPADFGLDPILAVHDRKYIDFLASAWAEWMAINPNAAAAPEASILLPATFALRRNPPLPASILGRAGYYMMDLSACIVKGTYEAALASAQCALSAADAIAKDGHVSMALCRPPGHHAGRDYAGGYCYINNAAVTANWLSLRGRVAVLDVDYHAGNGTQDIFYRCKDVLTISLHGDPEFEYPHYIGYAQERGEGEGLDFHHNFPLPRNTKDEEYLAALDQAILLIREFAPEYLVVSVGMDIHDGDPLGKFRITRDGIGQIGARIGTLKLPTAVVLEGGYSNEALGINLKTFLEGL
jgi:acetoin utilization deacetylase AcuC-like enzyme